MKCKGIREVMPDLASGVMGMTPEVNGHLASCDACSSKLEEFRQTMALLEEWQAPEPSPYFDVRLQARLREEMSKPSVGWFGWLRRPVLVAALTVLIGLGAGLYFTRSSGIYSSGSNEIAGMESSAQTERGTAVSDLQALDRNNDLYADFDLLDDLLVQQDVTANP
jgi:hypothetical protein